MTFNTSERSLVIAVFAVLFLTACGGDDSTSSNNDNKSKPSILKPSEPNTQTEGDKVIASNDASAALVASNTISLARTSCGLGGLSNDPALGDIAIKHANYIKHIFANTTPTTFDAHTENEISDISDVTGSKNPYFGGTSFEDRLTNANYANVNHSVTENIAQMAYFSSADNFLTPELAALSMTKSLLAAPYHLRSLMMPSASLTSSGMVAYQPYDKLKYNYAKGFVLVNHAAATSSIKHDTIKGIFTYPCQDVKDTVTALYNESPDPFRGARDLRTNPIGQPVYINMPSAKIIKVSNIEFRDVTRNLKVPIKQIDFDADPYKGTDFELLANEAFIMPLTDSFKSCETSPRQGNNCGLYGNSEYQVSFDVLVDNKDMQSKSFTFKTGEVTY